MNECRSVGLPARCVVGLLLSYRNHSSSKQTSLCVWARLMSDRLPTATPPAARLQPSLALFHCWQSLRHANRKRVNLDLTVKIKIIKEVDASTKQKDVASKFGIIESIYVHS